MRRVWTTKNETETISFGEHLGQRLKGGEVFLLMSDLGGGKTTLAKGIAKGLQITEEVSSPTFTIENIHKGRLTLHHYDLYRLGEMGIMNDELRETLGDTRAVSVIEWPEVALSTLPTSTTINIQLHRHAEDEELRSIEIKYPETLEYVFDGLGGVPE